MFHSAPDSTVGTLAYIHPELIESGNGYDGKVNLELFLKEHHAHIVKSVRTG